MAKLWRPTESDIAKLPKWVKQAYVVRCAKRCLPLFRPEDPHPLQADHLRSLISAIEVGDRACKTGKREVYGRRYAHAARAVYDDAYDDEPAKAAFAAYASVGVPLNQDTLDRNAYFAAGSALTADGESHTEMVRQDFELILRLTEEKNWDETTPISQEVFGQLWPAGEPDWFTEGQEWQRRVLAGEIGSGDDQPTESSLPAEEPGTIAIDFAIPESVSDDVFKRLLKETVHAANRHHQLLGGKGVRIRELRQVESAHVPETPLTPAGGSDA